MSLIKTLGRLRVALPALTIMAGLALSSTAQAGMTDWYSVSIATENTNWNHTVTLPKFDTSLGTLTGVEFQLDGVVAGNWRTVNLSDEPNVITGRVSATINLSRPDNSLIVATLPAIEQTTDSLAGNPDGTISFAPPIGATYNGLTDSASDSVLLTLSSDLSLFTGPGSIILPIRAIGTSKDIEDTGNNFSSYDTFASATASVRYYYTANAVPEPSSIALVGMGTMGFLAVHLRRKFRTAA